MTYQQLCLFSPGTPGAGSEVPWEGRAPRDLTRLSLARSLVREGMGRLDQDASHVGENEEREVQLDLPFPFALGGENG